MTTETFSTFFALLAFAALFGAVAIGVGALVWWLSPGAREWLAPVREDLGQVAVPLAWLVAATATAGSLYYSEVAHFEPCRFCWFQRTMMYPLAVVLLVAAVRRDRGIWRYALPLSVIGVGLSVYHYQLQRFPEQGSGGCDVGVPCTLTYVEEFGFVSIPFMAFCGFIAVCALLLLARESRQSSPGVGATSGTSEGGTDDDAGGVTGVTNGSGSGEGRLSERDASAAPAATGGGS